MYQKLESLNIFVNRLESVIFGELMCILQTKT